MYSCDVNEAELRVQLSLAVDLIYIFPSYLFRSQRADWNITCQTMCPIVPNDVSYVVQV